MARHQRLVFQRRYESLISIHSGAVPERVQKAIVSLDADKGGGIKIRHMEVVVTAGNITALVNTDICQGHIGFFKWPIDAAAPTGSTLDYENRGAVFGTTQWLTMGADFYRLSVRVKTITLRPGDALFYYTYKRLESGAPPDAILSSQLQFWVHDDNA